MTTAIETLTYINLEDMLANFGLDKLRLGRSILRRLSRAPAQRLAEQALSFDQCVGESGLEAAAQQWLLPYIHRLDVVGAAHVPTSGGVILAANHPGMTDTLAIFSGVRRSDLRWVSADRPFVRTLEHIALRTFFVSDRSGERMAAVRQVTRYLQQGGVVLICPAGQIEPDPAVMPGAVDSLRTWSASLGLFVRLAPQAVVVPTIVSGVVYGPALRHPLTRLRRAPQDRARIAATLQAYWQSAGRITRHMNVRVEFGKPLSAAELTRDAGRSTDITPVIISAVRVLLENVRRSETSPQTDRAYRWVETSSLQGGKQ